MGPKSMRIHTALDEGTIRQAIRAAGCTVERLNRHGSRSHAGSFDVILSGSSPRQGQAGGYMAATWDEWGVFLAAIFARDPRAKCSGAYLDAGHFAWATGGRYGPTFELSGQHRLHRWQWTGQVVTRTYTVHECECGAVRRYLLNGTPWAAISGTPDVTGDTGSIDEEGEFGYQGAYSVPDGHYAAEYLAGVGV